MMDSCCHVPPNVTLGVGKFQQLDAPKVPEVGFFHPGWRGSDFSSFLETELKKVLFFGCVNIKYIKYSCIYIYIWSPPPMIHPNDFIW